MHSQTDMDTACAASRRRMVIIATSAPAEGSRRDLAAMIAVTVFLAAGAWWSSVQALVVEFDSLLGNLIAAVCTAFGVWGGGIFVSCCCTASAKVGRTKDRHHSRRNPGVHPAKTEEIRRGEQALQHVLDELKKANKRGVQAIKKYQSAPGRRGRERDRQTARRRSTTLCSCSSSSSPSSSSQTSCQKRDTVEHVADST